MLALKGPAKINQQAFLARRSLMSDTHGQTNAHSCTLTHTDALTLKHTHTSMQHHCLTDTTEINKIFIL